MVSIPLRENILSNKLYIQLHLKENVVSIPLREDILSNKNNEEKYIKTIIEKFQFP